MSSAQATALRQYVDPVEQMADTAARLMKRYNGRRVKLVPKGTGGAGFDVLLDGQVVAEITPKSFDEARIREAVEARLCP